MTGNAPVVGAVTKEMKTVQITTEDVKILVSLISVKEKSLANISNKLSNIELKQISTKLKEIDLDSDSNVCEKYFNQFKKLHEIHKKDLYEKFVIKADKTFKFWFIENLITNKASIGDIY